MNSHKKWLLAVGVAAMITVNGIAMASVTPVQQDTTNGKKHAFVGKGEFKDKGFKEGFSELLKLLKIDEQTLKAELKNGKTLAAIAGEHDVSEQVLKDFTIKQMTLHVEEGVKAGRISVEQAEKMKDNMAELVSKMINGKVPMGQGHERMAGHAPFGDSKLLALLKVDADTLKNELKADKTLVAIAGEHGVSEQTLKDFLAEQMTQRIDEGVKAGHISAEKAEKMKADMADRVSQMINGKGPMPGQQKSDNS